MFQYLQQENGTAAIEYSLFISLILIIVAGALHVLGPNLVYVFCFISAGINPVHMI
jgi:Flp pilus assembly pilin Flp